MEKIYVIMNSEKIDKGLNWFEKALQMVEKYKFLTVFKAIIYILLIAATVGFISNPTWIFEQYEIWRDKQHTEAMHTREQNDIKIHNLVEKLNYRTNSDRVMVLELHNGLQNTAGLPFRKMSATYEAINVGVMPIATDYQQINLSLVPFADHMKTKGYWCGNTSEIEDIDRAFAYRLKSSGIEHFAAAVIEGVDKPLALLIVGFGEEFEEHNCVEVRENVRHCALELALLLELNRI
jgi:hypothetical protein